MSMTGPSSVGPRYKWVALSNTTLGVFMMMLDSSILIISLPAIFRGIHLSPLQASNIGYLPVDAHGLHGRGRRAGW